MSDLVEIRAKLRDGRRLSRADGMRLFATPDLLRLGQLAAEQRRLRHGDHLFFGATLNLNPTNICELRCPLCAFSRDAGEDGAYFMDSTAIQAYLDRYRDHPLTEVHIVGGLTPEVSLDYAIQVVGSVRRTFPQAFVQGFTAVEVAYLAQRHGTDAREVLKQLNQAGLDALPGGGAEIFAPRVRRLIAPDKLPADGYLRIHRTAHALGMPTNITMLYGHVETIAERLDHMLAVRDLQDRTGGVVAFVPIAFHPTHTRVTTSRTPGMTDLRLLAVARLLLDNVPHLRCLWNYLGIKLAQVAPSFGADDLGSTSLNERIARAAGARPDAEPSKHLLIRAARDAGLIPVLTDSGYRHRSIMTD